MVPTAVPVGKCLFQQFNSVLKWSYLKAGLLTFSAANGFISWDWAITAGEQRATQEHWWNHQIIVQSDRGTSTISSTASSGEQQFPYMVSATPQWYEVFHYKDTKMEREWESVRLLGGGSLYINRRLCKQKKIKWTHDNGIYIILY